MISVPPFWSGVDHDRFTRPSPEVPITDIGALGVVTGMAEAEIADCSLVPALLVADTVKVYERPFVSPRTMHEGDVETPVCTVYVHECTPGVEVTRYDVIGAPPLELGATQLTVA